MFITVNFTVGTDIRNAALEACKLADKLEICIEFDFNGCKCLVFPDGNPFKLVDRYHEDCRKETPSNCISNT